MLVDLFTVKTSRIDSMSLLSVHNRSDDISRRVSDRRLQFTLEFHLQSSEKMILL